MNPLLSRRAFLKTCCLGMAGLALPPVWPSAGGACRLGRVTAAQVNIYAEPAAKSEIRYKRQRDELVHLYYKEHSETGRNNLWYRVWGGYVHSAYIQEVDYRLNTAAEVLPAEGLLTEVSVPYTHSWQRIRDHWRPAYRLYYGSIHWAAGIEEGPQGETCYRVEDSYGRSYYAPAAHLRPISLDELTPLSPELPRSKKHIEVSISQQTLTAYEDNQPVFEALISSGVPQRGPLPEGEIPTDTPLGNFHITVKTPSRHMGRNIIDDDPYSGALPGVPWVCFFDKTGASTHGTYWHSNFGLRMSHGCINMRNEDALWIYRWSDPQIQPGERQVSAWGTRITIYD